MIRIRLDTGENYRVEDFTLPEATELIGSGARLLVSERARAFEATAVEPYPIAFLCSHILLAEEWSR